MNNNDKESRNIFLYTAKIILAVLVLILVVRTFLIEPYTISSNQMETSLLKGDDVFVDKTAYGVRLPITPLSVPFVYDNILGISSYSRLAELPYKRIGEGKIARNDVVLFNNPTEHNKPIDRRTLLVNRCIGQPGDTLVFQDGYYRINGKEYVYSPNHLDRYEFESLKFDLVKGTASKFNFPIRAPKQCGYTISILLSDFEYYIMKSNLEDSVLVKEFAENVNYSFIIPFKGMQLNISPENINIYKQAIVSENSDVHFDGNRLYLNGNELNRYTFMDDYYWFMSDNTESCSDSRTLGFIPFSHVIGRIWLIWYSSDYDSSRWDRCLMTIN